MQRIPLVQGEFYHIYNRGVDRRSIVTHTEESERFLETLCEFNTLEPIGSLYEQGFRKRRGIEDTFGGSTSKLRLVQCVAYCLNPNHFHLILTPLVDNGIEKFMHRFSTGFTRYFNERHERSGALFQGRYKSVHISSNEQLLHVSAYVNLNDRVHKLSGHDKKLVRSSWTEYLKPGSSVSLCDKKIIQEQFHTPSRYEMFAVEALKGILERRKLKQEDGVASLLLE